MWQIQISHVLDVEKGKMELKNLPKHMQTKEWILSEIHYEEFKGVQTIHACECGRGNCRSNMCVQCWNEILKEIK